MPAHGFSAASDDKQKKTVQQTPICPTCGCSLVRLGIGLDQAISVDFQEHSYVFCCQECVDLFNVEPERYLADTSNWVVCPACLAEKPTDQTVILEYKGERFHFCRCPHCRSEFMKRPEYFIARLYGQVELEETSVVCCDQSALSKNP